MAAAAATTSSPGKMSGGVSEAVRSRNAQAQADLRARRKTYISELEAKNEKLVQDNENLDRKRRYLEEQVGLMRGQVRTLKESLGMRKTAATSTVDSLLAAVEVERSKVRRLRSAIRNIALTEAQDSDSNDEYQASVSTRKRTRKSASPFVEPLDNSFELKQDSESVTTLSASSLSPPTPTQLDSIIPNQWSNAKPQLLNEEEQDSSRSALTLLLAQSSTFKRQVVDVLAHDLQAVAPTPLPSWNQWQSPPINIVNHNENKAHDEILDRFLSSIAASSAEPIRTPTVPFRPPRGHYCSASIFLNFFYFFLEGCLGMTKEKGRGKEVHLHRFYFA